MKKRVLFVVSTIAMVSSLVYAKQRSSIPAISKDYIDVLGTRLRLGMTKAEIAEKIVGVEADVKDEDEWIFHESTLQFKDGRLNFADREWTASGKSPVDAIFNLVTALNDEGYSACSMSTDTLPDPTMTSQRVWFHCGKKSIMIIKSTIGAKTYEEVFEQLGSLENRQK